jgi:hypothetical protein
LYLNCKERRKSNVCKRWLCNGRREHLKILVYYGGNFLNKGILEKLKKERKGLAFYIVVNKLKP